MWAIIRDVPCAEIGFRAILDEEGCVICYPSPMGEDNARLIAAAPDLLAALEQCVQVLKRGFDDADGDSRMAMATALEAIAKAKGGLAG
ncbi:hypothetical protein Hthe01_18560 [Hydrogenophilus thermoluteolus]|uniref:hypothetical protein n=1 Tax=Hydrogenophilus thermoluteolus TaxID=297 RepID=UPI0024A4EB3C|nr:hypothetical protein [Hydrogenophilus thermoluteolus]GLW61507.1 hypothetical protein Hthe01_18560 [Hydrogenophilus thermoluteolus]